MAWPTADGADQLVRELADARLANLRLRLLSELAREFSAATHDADALMSLVARRVADLFGDLCAIRLLSPDGQHLEPTGAIHHPDPEIVALARDAAAVHPQPLGEGLSGQVAATGKALVIPAADPAAMLAGLDPQRRPLIERLHITSLILAPLLSRGRVIGVISLTRSDPERPLGHDDLQVLQDLAAHAALAITNARSYAAERESHAAALTTDRHEAEQARALLAAIVATSNDAIISKRPDGVITSWNGAAVRLFGHSSEEAVGKPITIIVPPERREEERAFMERVLTGGRVDHLETVRLRKDGGEISVSVSLAPILDASGKVIGASKTARDLTAQRTAAEALRRTEDQLRQAQKMEAIGRLAGGIAHDFNNLLSVIFSYSEMILVDLEAHDPTAENVTEIHRAAVRAADLTRQLLMFSRQQVLAPRVLDLNDLLVGMDKMLTRILGEDVDLATALSPKLGAIRADPSNVEQVIMNLAVNARDAMPTGGQLTIETSNVELDADYTRAHLGSVPGPHVMLAVSDTGIGMDQATQARIFEPFFTTKEPGKGTGLGLSTVFGIVQQCGGNIWVYSEPGGGTTFKVYFPRVEGAVDSPVQSRPRLPLRGSETILLVEDQEQVRVVAESILEQNGYRVLAASGAGAALLLCEKHAGDIDLLLTDVVMPQMSGAELARRITQSRPATKLLFMSGYTDDSIVRHGVLQSGIAFLQKPFTPETLTRKVREVLGAAAPAPTDGP